MPKDIQLMRHAWRKNLNKLNEAQQEAFTI